MQVCSVWQDQTVTSIKYLKLSIKAHALRPNPYITPRSTLFSQHHLYVAKLRGDYLKFQSSQPVSLEGVVSSEILKVVTLT